MRYATLFSALTIAVSVGCGDSEGIITPTVPVLITGNWQGSTVIGLPEDNGVVIGRFEMVLVEDLAGFVSGSGFIRRGLGDELRTIAFDVTGANVFPDVSLSLHFREQPDAFLILGTHLLNYTAEFDASSGRLSLFGRLNGGFVRDTMLRVQRDGDLLAGL